MLELYLNNGILWKSGDHFCSPLLSVLELIAADGPSAFYRGYVAEAMKHTFADRSRFLADTDFVSATLQATLNPFVFDMSPIQAVAARRFHHQWHPNVLFMESGIRRIVHESLRHKGHRLELISAAGINQSVSARDGELRGASDLRKHGRAAGF